MENDTLVKALKLASINIAQMRSDNAGLGDPVQSPEDVMEELLAEAKDESDGEMNAYWMSSNSSYMEEELSW